MKNKLKFLLIPLLILESLSLSAQDTYTEEDLNVSRKVSFMIRGGLNVSNLRATQKKEYADADSKTGYNIGLYIDIPLQDNDQSYMLTGLSLTSKGAKINDLYATMEALYLQIPLYFGGAVNLPNPNVKFKLAAGPYLAYGIGGETSVETSYNGPGGSADTFGKGSIWNKAEVGLGLDFGLEIQKFVLSIGVESGLTNAWNSKYLEDDIRVTNWLFSFNTGFKF